MTFTNELHLTGMATSSPNLWIRHNNTRWKPLSWNFRLLPIPHRPPQVYHVQRPGYPLHHELQPRLCVGCVLGDLRASRLRSTFQRHAEASDLRHPASSPWDVFPTLHPASYRGHGAVSPLQPWPDQVHPVRPVGWILSHVVSVFVLLQPAVSHVRRWPRCLWPSGMTPGCWSLLIACISDLQSRSS